MSGTTGASGDMYFSADGGVYDASGTMIGTYETDAAGNVDAVSSDTDGDGTYDTAAVDTDRDGTADTTAHDPAGF